MAELADTVAALNTRSLGWPKFTRLPAYAAFHNAASVTRADGGWQRAGQPACSARMAALDKQNLVSLAGNKCYILISLPEHPALPPISDLGLSFFRLACSPASRESSAPISRPRE